MYSFVFFHYTKLKHNFSIANIVHLMHYIQQLYLEVYKYLDFHLYFVESGDEIKNFYLI